MKMKTGKENIMAKERKFPYYMYHKDFDEPMRVDNKDEARQLAEKGYEDHYIHKDYPKWVNGKIVPNKAAHEALLAEQPKVVKGELSEDQQQADEAQTSRRGRKG